MCISLVIDFIQPQTTPDEKIKMRAFVPFLQYILPFAKKSWAEFGFDQLCLLFVQRKDPVKEDQQ